jgi:hypothetical protein
VAVDPDDLLQRLLNYADKQVRRLQAKERNGAACEHCGQKATIEPFEALLVQRYLRIVAQVAFGGRKLITEKKLRQLSEGELERLEAAADEKGPEAWLPKV